MELAEDTPEDHRRRSEFIQSLIQSHCRASTTTAEYATTVPRTIIQFWHNMRKLPKDVKDCIGSWKSLEKGGFTHLLFTQENARLFITQRLGERYRNAFDRCYHPAMKSDYFRLCYIHTEGGFYVDADDVYCGTNIDHLFLDGRLKIQPLCYDIATESMVEPSVFTQFGAYSPNWIFYFNNNPLIASAGHPVIERALSQATWLLEQSSDGDLPEIQSTTGPGNLTKSIFDLGIKCTRIDSSFLILRDWETIAVTKWPLSYRNDARNWRLSNQHHYHDKRGATG